MYTFLLVLQDLEMRLGGILSENLKYCWDTMSKLRLLDVFQGVTRRELVQVGITIIESNSGYEFRFESQPNHG